jgi:hypothetical protein
LARCRTGSCSRRRKRSLKSAAEPQPRKRRIIVGDDGRW